MTRVPRLPPFPAPRHTGRVGACRVQSGAVVVELAIVSLLLATMMFGALDLGRAMYAYNQIVQSSRAAARYLATSSSIGSTEVARATRLVIYGSFETTGGALTPELAGQDAQIQFCAPSYCDITGKTTAQMSNQAVTGASTVNLVMVSVSNLTLVSYFPQTISNMIFRPIVVTFPRVS